MGKAKETTKVQVASEAQEDLSGVFPLSTEDLCELEGKNLDKLHDIGSSRDYTACLAKLSSQIKTDLKRGIIGGNEPANNETRIRRYGINKLPEVKYATLLEIIIDSLKDPILILLMISSAVSITLGMILHGVQEGWVEGVAILVAIFVVASVSSINNFQKELQFQKLNRKKNERFVNVVRDGEVRNISMYEVMVGDLVQVATGDIICADGLFVEGHNVKCDESSATGESDAMKKSGHDDPFFLSGTQCIEGLGIYLVTAVGEHSFFGKTLMGLRIEPEETPLQQKLAWLATFIGKVSVVVASLVVVILFIKEVVRIEQNDLPWDAQVGEAVVKFLITAITVVVVAVPEGLPLAVTISLAYAMTQLLKENNLVRRLEACETMGGVTAICSDKTGTLTTNKMTVVKGWLGGVTFENQTEAPKQVAQAPADYLALVFEGICLNSSATETRNEKTGQLEFFGSKTECAMLGFAANCGYSYGSIREANRDRIASVYPFSSSKKRMSVLLRNPQVGGAPSYRLFTKGASEMVLDLCTEVVSVHGETQRTEPLTAARKKEINDIIMSFASEGLRTICIAYRDVDEEVNPEGDAPESNMVCLGIVGIEDPLRPEVKGAVEAAHRAGIIVRMVTGDNIITAKNIAKKCGIFHDDGISMEGKDFRAMTEEQMDKVVPKLQVLARSSPTDKQLLVGYLKKKGEIVAVTGDGINDAPALKMAHVGFAMGIAGTEVAKEAAGIILMDDNFASIISALSWGRNTIVGIQRFLNFDITICVSAVLVAFISAISDQKGESALAPIQLLWINLCMDSLSALALATEKPRPEILLEKPRDPKSPIITPSMWKNIVGQAIYQTIISLALLWGAGGLFNSGNAALDYRQHETMVFNVFVIMNVFNEFNARMMTRDANIFKGLAKHPTFAAVILFSIGGQALIINFGGDFFHVTPLNGVQWAICMGIGLAAVPIGTAIRLLPDPKINFSGSFFSSRRKSGPIDEPTPTGKKSPEERYSAEKDRPSTASKKAWVESSP